jgi:hypothetical protein
MPDGAAVRWASRSGHRFFCNAFWLKLVRSSTCAHSLRILFDLGANRVGHGGIQALKLHRRAGFGLEHG